MKTILSALYPRGYRFRESEDAGSVEEIGLLPATEKSAFAVGRVVSASDTILVRGWAIDPHYKTLAAGVIIALGEALAEAQYGSERRDVARRFDNSGLTASGFCGVITPLPGVLGQQDLSVFAVGADGDSAFRVGNATGFTIVASSAPLSVKMPHRAGVVQHFIDSGIGGQLHRGETLEVSGWAFDSAATGPVRGVFLVIDDTNVVHGACGLPRPDVARNLENDAHKMSGFIVRFNTLGLAAGRHRLKIGFVNTDGTAHESFDLDDGFEILQVVGP